MEHKLSPPRIFLLFVRPLLRLDSHHRLGISFAAALVFFLFPLGMPLPLRLTTSWTAFAIILLFLAWAVILAGDPAAARRSATLQDAGLTAIFVIVIAGAVGSLTAVGALLFGARASTESTFISEGYIAVVAVTMSWLLVHTMFALRYAHIYHGSGERPGGVHGGLLFPGGHLPDFLDFAYFSFVVGMTSQVSDIQISSRRLRRLTLVHSVISFVFNTIILALTINIVASVMLR
jgi:uncharacterized membrane protein